MSAAADARRILPLLTPGTHVIDGAMGTALIAAGLGPGEVPETWNVLPDRMPIVRAVHRGHREAGAQVILTNTFGGHPVRIALTEDGDRALEFSLAAATLARAEAKGALVGGSIGPTGMLLEPWGSLSAAEARAGYAVQARGLAQGGVDLAWIETMIDIGEARAAVEGVREAAPDLPIVVTFAFEGERTMMGATPEQIVATFVPLGVIAIGANCGGGYAPVERAIARMRAADPAIPLVAKSNAGTPTLRGDGVTTYPGAPGDAAAHARRVVDLGATIVGGCCGSTADHIRAIAAAVGGAALASD